MIKLIQSFLKMLFNTPVVKPLFGKIGDVLQVPAGTVITYAVNGFGIYWLRYLLIVLAIAAVVVLTKLFGWLNKGNASKYNPEKMEKVPNSPLKGKNFIFLGSSVTKGFASCGKSFVDMIAYRDDASCVKEAVSGTTLVDKGANSYVSRLKKLDKNQKCDVFVCQLSTNDATKNAPLGQLSDSRELSAFDTGTIYGAMEYIIAYAKAAWNCPVVFYSNPQYADERYEAMTRALEKVADKWDVQVIDLWNDREVNEKYTNHSCRNDQIHPTKKGYQAWTPIFEEALACVLAGKQIPARATVSAPSAEELKKKRSSKKLVKIVKIVVWVLVAFIFHAAACGLTQADATMDLTGPSNSNKYAPDKVEKLADSPIEGKTILWLGSSVVDGFGARHTSMAEYVSVRNGCTMIKDVYSGTYLATTSENDYLPRLLKHDATTDPKVDLVVVQLSTNDCKQLTEVGEPTANDMFDLDQLDTTTTCGALEYILGYAKETWGCPTLVFTSLWFDEKATVTGLQKADIYQEMVDKTQVICDKWGSYMLDMWYDEHILDGIDDQLFDAYMTDSVHPSRRGYLEWWTPKFEEIIYQIFAEKEN